MTSPTEQISIKDLENLLRKRIHIDFAPYLSQEAQERLVEETIAVLQQIPELNYLFPLKTHNTRCPVERCESVLPVQSRDRGLQLCVCRTHQLLVGWEDGAPILGVVRSVVSDEEQ
jgi:hypothetical protein